MFVNVNLYRDIDVQPQFTVHQGRPEEITMREDLGNITLVGDDGFGKSSYSLVYWYLILDVYL